MTPIQSIFMVASHGFCYLPHRTLMPSLWLQARASVQSKRWAVLASLHPPVSVIHRDPFAPEPTVAAISIIGEEGAPPCDMLDHPLELPEAAEGGGHHCQWKTKSDRDCGESDITLPTPPQSAVHGGHHQSPEHRLGYLSASSVKKKRRLNLMVTQCLLQAQSEHPGSLTLMTMVSCPPASP